MNSLRVYTSCKYYMYFTGETTQGSITVSVVKNMRMKNTMLGWFQFQHGDGTADSWTMDDVNVTLSLDSSSDGSATGESGGSSSGSSTWIYGVIAGVVIVVIVALIIGAIVIVKMRSRKERYEFNAPTKSVMHTEFENPLYGPMEGTLAGSDEIHFNVSEENHDDK